MMRGNLPQRLFGLILLVTIPSFTLHEALEIRTVIRTAAEHTASDAQGIATATLPLLKNLLVIGDLATVQETLNTLMGHGQFRSMILLAADGHTPILQGKASPAKEHEQAPEWFSRWLDYRFQVQQFPILVGGHDYGVLAAEPSPDFLVNNIWERLWTALQVWIISLFATFSLLHMTLRRSLRPLEALAEAAHCIGRGNLTCRAPVSDIPELAQTANAFNLMANNLADAHERLEERVQQATLELNNLIIRIPVGVYKLRTKTDGNLQYEFVSPRWCEQMELSAERVYRDPFLPLHCIHPDEVDEFLRIRSQAFAAATPFQWEGRLREGMRTGWLHMESIPHRQPNGDILWEGIQYDITASKDRETTLEQIAHYDTLTGIPNRMLLADRMHQAIAQARRSNTTLAVCYLDLDDFKPVNDQLGHEAGDQVLVETAHRLQGTLRGGDTVARIGGDEFVLLLANMTRLEEYEVSLKRIVAVVNRPITLGNQQVSVSASLGIALYPKDGSEPDTLLRQADQAMYQAKQAGRNSYIYFDRLLEQAAGQYRATPTDTPPPAGGLGA